MNSQFRLGIQSYCFRKYPELPDLISALKQAGLSYVELWPKHAPAEMSKADQQKALSLLKENGITVDSYGCVALGKDEANDRRIFEFAKLAGIRSISANPAPDGYALCEKLCEEYGINLAIHNHGRKHQYGSFEQLDAVFANTSERFGLCLDAAWFLDAGHDPVEAARKYADRLYGVHLKDFTFDADGKHQDVIIGTGGLDLPALLSQLAPSGFDGYLSIEYEGDKDDPIPNTVKCVQAVQQALEEIRVPA